MRDTLTRAVKRALQRYGFDIVRVDETPAPVVDDEFPPDFDEATKAACREVHDLHHDGAREGLRACAQAVRHVVTHDIPGAIVECGVWRGGSMMVAARTLLELGAANTRAVPVRHLRGHAGADGARRRPPRATARSSAGTRRSATC